MTKTTAPRVRALNLYTIELDGKPVAQAMAISQAEAVRLYVESVQQPAISARMSTPIEARTLAGLPLLTRGDHAPAPAPESDPRVPDMFDDEPADPLLDGLSAGMPDHVEVVLAMVSPQHAPIAAVLEGLASGAQEPAAAQHGKADGGHRADSELKRQAEQAAARRAMAGKPVAMYLNPANGSTWSGRGLKPRWLVEAIEAGRAQEEFLIDTQGAQA